MSNTINITNIIESMGGRFFANEQEVIEYNKILPEYVDDEEFVDDCTDDEDEDI